MTSTYSAPSPPFSQVPEELPLQVMFLYFWEVSAKKNCLKPSSDTCYYVTDNCPCAEMLRGAKKLRFHSSVCAIFMRDNLHASTVYSANLWWHLHITFLLWGWRFPLRGKTESINTSPSHHLPAFRHLVHWLLIHAIAKMSKVSNFRSLLSKYKLNWSLFTA